MAMARKVYVVEDADPEASSGIPAGTFPGTLAGLIDALDAARYRSAAGTPKALVIAEGKERQVIRRFENGNDTWSASRIEIRIGRATDRRPEADHRVSERRVTVPTSRHRG
jgi:hypothetical protein